MAIADTINSIRTHLTEDYESLENIGADLTNVDKNIENIASVVNGIYDNLPKTTGESSNLSLTTLKGKMNIIPKGDTKQEGTPTPDTPIDIEVVTGTQEVKVENVNLFNGTLYKGQVLGDGNINPSPTNRVTNVQTVTGSITYLKAGTYTISAPNLDYCALLTKNASGTILQNFANQWNALPFNFTLTQGGYVYFTLRNENNTDLTPSECSAQIEKGSVATTYTPHQEQVQQISLGDIELCKIGNYQDYLYKTSGKNLLDTSQSNINIGGATSTITYDNAGFMTITNNNSSASYINIPIATDNVEVGQPYTLKVDWGTSELTYIYLQNSNDNYSKYIYTTTTTTTTNTPVSNFLKVLILVNANKTIKVRVQVQKGNTISGDYEPYGSGIWYKKEYIGKYTFTGNENWFKHSTTSNNLFYISPVYNPIVSNMKKPSTNNVALECYSEMAQYKAVNTMARNSVIGINPSVAGDIYVGTSLSGISDRDVFKTYLQTHPTTFLYQYITPNDIQITNETLISQLDNLEKLKSYNGITNINCSGNLSAILGVSALKGE